MNTETPLVSVVIPTYNRAHTISQAIDSVLNQTYRNYEIIIINDGSTDTTEKTLKPFEGKITYIAQANKGVSAARNAGIQRARGDYMAFLDSDDLWYPQKLEKQIEAIQRNKEYAFCLTDIEYINETGVHLSFSNLRQIILQDGSFFEYLLRGFAVTCSYMLIKKDMFNAAGLFDENLKTAEDIDMLLRITSRCQGILIDEPLVKYRRGNSHLSGRLFTKNRIKALENIKSYAPDLFKKHQKLISQRTAKINLEYAEDLLWHRYLQEARKLLISSMKSMVTMKCVILFFKSIFMEFLSCFSSKYKDKGEFNEK